MADDHYVYAIVASGAVLPAGVTGLMDAPLSAVACRDLAAVTSRVDGPIPRAVPTSVMRHEEVVEAVWRAGPSLPVRFGTTFPDVASVERALDRRYDALATDLIRLGGKLEFGLSALWDITETVDGEPEAQAELLRGSGGPGVAYLRTRAEQIRRDDARRAGAGRLAEEVDARLGPHALERRRTLLPTERLAIRTAYLVDTEQVHAFRAAFEELRRELESHRFLLSGPWPPYSFVSRDDTANPLTGSAGAQQHGRAGSADAILERGEG